MRNALAALALFGSLGAPAADWVSEGGDAQRSGWQPRERDLTAANVNGMKLLWKKELDDRSLTSPVMLGPIITHRGIKELVFVAGASNHFYAVDADLGRIFWTRHIETAAIQKPDSRCNSFVPATPVIAPELLTAGQAPPGDDEGHTPIRPIYFVASDGELHRISPSTGEDMGVPKRFLGPNAHASSLNLWNDVLYTSIPNGCGGPRAGVWSISTKSRDARPPSFVSRGLGVSIGRDGTVYATGEDSVLPPASVMPVSFTWNGRELVAGGEGGSVVIAEGRRRLASARLGDSVSGLATWEDSGGERWVYAAGGGRVGAFKLSGAEKPELTLVWETRGGSALGVANGIVFTLSSDDHAVLRALDAATGKELHSSGEGVIAAGAHSLAIANGHVCFTAGGNTLYCFGLPLEI
jgi:outer membrane protein assembly factor BamB